MNILVIEDSPFYQKIFSRILSKLNLPFEITSDGAQGIDAIENGLFDLVFLDIKLPDMSGWKVLEEIDEYRDQLKIVTVSGYESVHQDPKFRSTDPNNFLVKPFEDSEILSIMGINEKRKIKQIISNTLVSQNKEEKDMKNQLEAFCSEIGYDQSIPLLDMLVTELNSKVPKLTGLLAQGHFSEIESYVHQLKSNCRYFGLNDYAEICDEIEFLIVQDKSDQINDKVSTLVDQLDTILDVIKQVEEKAKTFVNLPN